MALQGHLAKVKLKSSGTAMTDEATTTGDDTSYQITNSAKRIIDLDTTLVVEDGGVPTTEEYSIDYLNGTVTFTSVDAGRVITITGAYLTPATVATAYSYNFNGSSDILENTPFESTTRTYQAGLITGTLSLSRYHLTDDLFTAELLAGDTFIIEMYMSDTEYISMYGILTTDNIGSSNDGLIEESLDFQITTQLERS